MGPLLLYSGATGTNSSPLRKNFSFKGLIFVSTALVKVKPFDLRCPGQIPCSTCPTSPRCPTLTQEGLLSWENCGKLRLNVHTNFACPQTVNKGSSQLCPLFIFIVTVYYEQKHIPKLNFAKTKKKNPSVEHSTASARTLSSGGQRGDAAAQYYRSAGTW